ncbi:hypothetical protein N656DRAFT_709924 [Canariomyces notabilis]|uniref:Uncharacterized protein n=1 Tax=Canariomyces notabilis TaxID=2074819 RepID=A0AAN6TCU2_9PEZI|nr:hypothetical protein N656DRAFT_709924 [Canariomyces arenarius]
MGDTKTDLLISNGTCYYAKGKLADNYFIPCGNAAFGHIHCCSAGNKCLVDNACYSDEYGTTYLAACTNESYSDDRCPDKKAYRGTAPL